MNFKMCDWLFSFCFLHETVFGNGQVAITHNVRGLCVVALSRNLKLTTTHSWAITQNPCYVPLIVVKCTNERQKKSFL